MLSVHWVRGELPLILFVTNNGVELYSVVVISPTALHYTALHCIFYPENDAVFCETTVEREQK